ncbi:MAG: protein translocase subunit SecD [Candidatus Omnitrophota bacterium]|jgi:protein-export membrane protein SecD/preprotein translocase SecF subunit|nr:MAG: protein translocase subunit SecD [Candidatus Omnitrophota bacterium]
MQRVPLWKIVVIVFVILFSLWMLTPTLTFYSYSALVRNSGETPEMAVIQEQIKQNPPNVLELQNRLKTLKQDFSALRNDSIRLGLDLQGGVHLVIEVDQEKFLENLRLKNPNATEEEKEYALTMALDSAAAVVENRVNQYGVAESAIVKQPPTRLVLELPGFSDPEQVENLVQAEAVLHFQIVGNDERKRLGELIDPIDTVVPEDFKSLLASTDPYRAALIVQYPENVEIVKNILQREVVQSIIDRDLVFKWGQVEESNSSFNYRHQYLYLLKKKVELTGEELEDAWLYMNQQNQPVVTLTFNSAGARIFRRVTRDFLHEHLAVVLNDIVYAAPEIITEIRDGRAEITGINDFTEARQISVVLRAGALPAPLKIAESRVVGPSLGRDSIRQGIWGGIVGGLVVLVFMVGYYAVAGVIADFGVLFSLFLLISGMAMFKATLTLPGIAGIVLMIGMAVDANVLIFERLREEMHGKKAKTVQLVLEKGYGRAFMTIFDANITTLITALVLFQFGTGPIKGFAVTLSLGILVSMFSAVFVSRVIYDTMVGYGMKELSVGKLRFFESPSFDFFSRPKLYMGATTLFGVLGFLFLSLNWNTLKGIDFAGGAEINIQFEDVATVEKQTLLADEEQAELKVQFNDPITLGVIREKLGARGYKDSVVREVSGETNQILIRVIGDLGDAANTPETLEEKLKAALPDNPFTVLEYYAVKDPTDRVRVQSVRDGLTGIGLTDTVIQEVLGQQNQMLVRVREGVVASPTELESKVRQALPDHALTVLSTDIVGEKVGGELLLKGLYCIIFSSIGILLYITVRFEFRFAVAAVVALFHDLLFTLAILAITGTEFNLPIVAALLTVLGYSLNDTIVVFDRIRENYSSAQMNFREVVNHSINQTLSRTVNTSMTTLFVVTTLHLLGGPVIHDFAFTLMIGIIIGTYSSIFVASPILLMMGKEGFKPAPVKNVKAAPAS